MSNKQEATMPMPSAPETMHTTKMYTSLNICQRFTRLVETEETEEIPAVHEEISYLFTTWDAHSAHRLQPLDKYATLQNKRFCFRNFGASSKVLYSMAMKYHRQAEDAILTDSSASNLAKIHGYIIDLLSIHRYVKIHHGIPPQSEAEGHRNFLRYKNSFLKITELPPHAMQKLTSGLINRQQDGPVKGYFHLMLDITWLLITMNAKSESTTELTELMQQVYFVMYKCYEKCNKFTVICSCMSVFWLRVQLYCEELNIQFWKLHNAAMSCYDEEFTLYALKFMADLQRYNTEGKLIGVHCHRVQENVEFFNQTWSLLLKNTSDADEMKIFKILVQVEELLSDLWLPHGKLEFYYLTWEYYQKKIDEIKEQRTFQQLLNQIELESSFETVQSVQFKGQQKGDIRNSGYLIFLRMLQKHLGRHPHHWNKFKGRIYTKFPPMKFQKLSEQGLRNIALVFFALSSANVQFEETSGKLLMLLKDLPVQKQNLQSTWLIYIFLIKLHLDKSTPITPVYNIFGPFLEDSSKIRNNFHLVTLFASNLSSYFRVDDLTLKQSLLINTWLESYIKSCAHDDLISLLNSLAMIIERTVDSGAWYEYQNAFVTHILCPLKRLGINQSIIGTVAGLIVANSEGLDDVVEHFISENVPGDVMMSFFMTLRRKSTFTTNERREFLTVKAWCWSWFVGVENVSFTEDIAELLKVSNIAPDNNASVFERFLKSVDPGTLLRVLKDSERYFAKNSNLHVYTNMALVFHYCGSTIYIRTASSCYLSSFVDQFLLPMDVLRGTKPAFLSLVEKTWHLFMFSLWELHSNEADPYLERLIKDLTLRYIPHFSSKPTVLLKITNNQLLSDFVFMKIASEFFEQNKSKHVGDECLFKALNSVNTVLDDLLFEGLHKKDLIVLFARRFLPGFYDVYMFKNHKVIVINMVKKLAGLRSRYHEIRQLFADSLKGAIKKHLAFSTNQYFQMCYVLVKVIGDVVQGMLGTIREEISVLECKRGQGFDNHLRQCYDKLVKLC